MSARKWRYNVPRSCSLLSHSLKMGNLSFMSPFLITLLLHHYLCTMTHTIVYLKSKDIHMHEAKSRHFWTLVQENRDKVNALFCISARRMIMDANYLYGVSSKSGISREPWPCIGWLPSFVVALEKKLWTIYIPGVGSMLHMTKAIHTIGKSVCTSIQRHTFCSIMSLRICWIEFRPPLSPIPPTYAHTSTTLERAPFHPSLLHFIQCTVHSNTSTITLHFSIDVFLEQVTTHVYATYRGPFSSLHACWTKLVYQNDAQAISMS